MINNVANADSVMDYDDDKGRRRFIVNHTSTMHLPVICLDDDDDDDDLKIDKDYKMFLEHLIDDNSLGPLCELNSSHPIRYEVDNGESETRKFDMFSGELKRLELQNEYPMNNRVSEQGKRKTVGFKAEISRASSSLVVKRETIQRDNRASERRKRRISLLAREQDNIQRDTKMSDSKAETSRRAVPLVRAEEDIQQVNNVKVNTSGHVPLVKHQEGIQEDHKVCAGRKRRLSVLQPETIRSAVPLVRHQEDIQPDKKVMKTDCFYVYTLSGVRLLRKQEVIQRDHKVSQGRKSKFSKLEPDTLRRNVPLARTEEDTERANVIAERRKREIVKTKAAGTSKVAPTSVTSRIFHETQRNKGHFAGRRKKNEEEIVAVVDKDYMSYLTWLVHSFKYSEATNLQNDPSDLDPPVLATLKESTIVPEKELLVNVKVEQDLESRSDDSDIIAVSDSPFSDGEGTPFVASKSVVDLDEESKEDESMFTKELMDVLKKPFNEKELLELFKEASMQKPVTRCRELRKGREKFYATDQVGPSYLQKFSDFEKEYKLVDGVDKAKALKLLRGFFFYLRNCSRDGAFKPWSKDI